MPGGPIAPPRFRLLSRADLKALPEVRWLVEGLLPERGVVLFYGDSGIGKTFVTIAFSGAVATGLPIFNRACEGGSVVYLAGEGEFGIGVRLDAWDDFNKAYAEKIHVLTGRPALAIATNVETIGTALELSGIKPSLVVIDTLSTHYPGGNENDPREMTLFMEGARRISERFDCCVVIVHHTPKYGEGPRGSTVLTANVDTVMELAIGGTKQLVLFCKKQKDGPPFEDTVIDLRPHSFSDGDEEHSSLVATLGSEIEPTLDGSPTRLTKQDEAIIRLLHVGPKQRGELRKEAGIPEGSIDAVISKLRNRGLIAKSGPNKRDPYALTESGKSIPIENP
jgi:hypothetical protein